MNLNKIFLIVDDDDGIRELTAILVENLFDIPENLICKASNGLEALKIINEKKVGIVLSDNNMPGMDGIDMLRVIRKTPDPEIANMPVIIMSVCAEGEEMKFFEPDAKADGFLFKPFRNGDLAGIIKNLETQGRL